MSSSEHPSNGGSTCHTASCGQKAQARVTHPLLPGTVGPAATFTIIRPITGPKHGLAVCLDCAHSAVDNMLMAAVPPGDGPPAERIGDGQ